DGPFQDGSYYFTFSTGDGILREEGARLTSPVTHEVTGSYSYTAPNGKLIIMEYIADENGYRAFPVRSGRPSLVNRPQRIPVPPPYRPPLSQTLDQSFSDRSTAFKRSPDQSVSQLDLQNSHNNQQQEDDREQSSASEEEIDL
ncbi:hypothetical protein OTU49_009424, partial [Cherax quadricarinatus]